MCMCVLFSGNIPQTSDVGTVLARSLRGMLAQDPGELTWDVCLLDQILTSSVQRD